MWKRYLLNKLFSIVDTCLNCKDIARQICAMVPRWQIFDDFLASCICSEPCAARFRPASEIRTKATPCVRRLRLGEEKRRNHRMKIFYRATIKKPHGKNVMSASAKQGGHNNAVTARNLQQQQQRACSRANRDKASKSLDPTAICLRTLQLAPCCCCCHCC